MTEERQRQNQPMRLAGERGPAVTDEDIAVEEGEPETLQPVPQPEPTPAPDTTPRKRDTRRVRGRMTLRIPDDVVSRPSDSAMATAPSHQDAPPAEKGAAAKASVKEPSAAAGSSGDVSSFGPALAPTRIITINPPPPDPVPRAKSEPPLSAPLAPRTLKDLGPDSVDDSIGDARQDNLASTQPNPSPAPEVLQQRSGAFSSSPDILIEEDIPPEPASSDAAPPTSSDIDFEEAAPSNLPVAESGRHAVAAPRSDGSSAPSTAESLPEAPPSGEALVDGEEVGLKSEPPPRPSEPGEPAEVSPEDVVSVESAPHRKPAPPPPVSAPKLASTGPNPTAKALGTTGQNLATPAGYPPDPRAAPQPISKPPPPVPKPPLLLVPSGASPLAPPPMNEAAATRKRGRPWWEELFNDDFIRTMAKITDAQIAAEVDFIEERLELDRGAMVLDLACGTGRHAIEMTSRGYKVVGFDLSLAMLARAADEAQERDQRLNFVQGDMREMTFEETFDGIYVWNTSFGFFEDEKNAVVVANLRKALKAGGLLLLDVANRDYLARQSPSLAWFEGDGCVCMDEMHIDWITSRMRVKRTMMLDDGRTKETDYTIRVYSLHELGKILHENGFKVSEVSGRLATPGVFFGADSPRILVVAEKR
jgi:SAM-dependent methyltransferase